MVQNYNCYIVLNLTIYNSLHVTKRYLVIHVTGFMHASKCRLFKYIRKLLTPLIWLIFLFLGTNFTSSNFQNVDACKVSYKRVC